MILDHISRAEKYHHVHTSFRHAFDFLQQNDIASMKPGHYDIEGKDIYLIVSHSNGNNGSQKLESHRKYIDIQIAVSGVVSLGWKNQDSCNAIVEHYDDAKDVQMYGDDPEFTVKLNKGMFTVVFPEDAHSTIPAQDKTIKAVVKVAI